jgi:hypothetical protein
LFLANPFPESGLSTSIAPLPFSLPASPSTAY